MAELRNRKKQKKQGQTKRTNPSDSNSVSTPQQTPSEEAPRVSETKEPTAGEIVANHVIFKAIPIGLLFYGLYKGFFYLILKRPDLVATATLGQIALRPAVSATDPRQLLIVGSLSSGTTQVTADLHDHLKLEVVHEISNADTNFARDGTVSWFHALRYWKPPFAPDDGKTKALTVAKLCTNHTAHMGFHPSVYRPSPMCSSLKKWSRCWAKECFRIVHSEWGCAWNQACETPFVSVLHQVRHPLRTIASLVAKHCEGGKLNGTTMEHTFVKYMSVFFLQHDWTSLSCIESAGHFVVDYNMALLEADDAGLLDGRYKIEESSPCDVARLAGLMDQEKTVYHPNYVRITELCDTRTTSEASNIAQQVMVSKRGKKNKGRVSLRWNDLRGGEHGSQRPKGDTTLEDQVRALAVRLGYDLN